MSELKDKMPIGELGLERIETEEQLKAFIGSMKPGVFMEDYKKIISKVPASFQPLVNDLKKTGDFFSIPKIANTCDSLVKEILRAKSTKIPVPYCKFEYAPYGSTTAYTDFDRIYANAGNDLVLAGENLRDKLELLYGLFVHEASHILYTDFNFLRDITNFFKTGEKLPFDVKDIPSDLLESYNLLVEDIKSSPKVANYLASYYHQLDNCIEDGYIEPRYMREYEGSSVFSLSRLRNVFWNQLPSVEEVVSREELMEREDSVAWKALGFLLPYSKYGAFKVSDSSTKLEETDVYKFAEASLYYIDKAVKNDYSSLRSRDSFFAFLSLYKNLKEIMPEFPDPEDRDSGEGDGDGGDGLDPVEWGPGGEGGDRGKGSEKGEEVGVDAEDIDYSEEKDSPFEPCDGPPTDDKLIVNHDVISDLDSEIAKAKAEAKLAERNGDLSKGLDLDIIYYKEGPKADDKWRDLGLEKYYQQGKQAADQLRNELEKNQLSIVTKYRSKGRLDISSVIRAKANNTTNYYREKTEPIPKDLASFYLVIDTSGSMRSSNRMTNAKKTAAILAGFCDELKLDYGIAGFSSYNKHHNLVDLDEEKTDKAIHKIALLEPGADESLAPTLKFAHRKLNRAAEEKRIANRVMLIISDGGLVDRTDYRNSAGEVGLCYEEGMDVIAVSYGSDASRMLKDWMPENKILETFNADESAMALCMRLVDIINTLSQK